MEIPEYFVKNASRQFGQKGPEWVRQLPWLLSRCLSKWHLENCVPVEGLSINLVCFATSRMHGDVVLKIEGPHSERYTEMLALQRFGGRYACECLKVDYEMGAILLERLVPGRKLRSVSDRQTQLEVGTGLMLQLPCPLEDAGGFPHYTDWMERAFQKTQQEYRPGAEVASLMDAASELVAATNPDTWPSFLLHGDLHHDNILESSGGVWKVIDPQGVIGAPFLESARFIQNHVMGADHTPMDKGQLDQAVAYVAERMGETKHRIATALFVDHLLSMCWGYEMNFAAQHTDKMLGECVWLLGYVRRT
ncbi:aminoglycoside phosphotransferase family protein [Chloroflexota bacterium]